MALKGRVEQNYIVELAYEAIDDTPGLVWVDIPDYLVGNFNLSSYKLDDSGKVVPADGIAFKETLKNLVASKRYNLQKSGSVVYDGNRYPTDRDSTNTLTSAIGLAQLSESVNGPGTFTTPWKTMTGFAILKFVDLAQIAVLSGQFTAELFTQEGVITNNIDNSTDYEEMVNIALEAFPAVTYSETKATAEQQAAEEAASSTTTTQNKVSKKSK